MKNLLTTLLGWFFISGFPHGCYKAWHWYNQIQMKRQSKFLLILLCLSLLLFKAVSGNRFIENGIKRAEIYSNYSAYILAQQQVEASGIDDKNNLTRAISVHMLAIVIGIFVLFGTTQLKQAMRAILKILNGAQLNKKIFKPPRNMYISI
jgi:hypothetical protein